MEIKKIITHNGVFHADEIIAIALLDLTLDSERYPNIATLIERKIDISQEELDDPTVIVIDVGLKYNPELNNYDHHHNNKLPCAASLIRRHFLNNEIGKNIHQKLVEKINMVDLGNKKADDASISQTILNYNNLPIDNPFFVALDTAQTIVWAYYETAKLAIQNKEKINQLERKLNGKVIIDPENTLTTNWKQLAQNHRIFFKIAPNSQEPNKWSLISRDADEIVIPESETQTFRHNSGFLAVYNTLEDAIQDAQTALCI